MKVLYIGDNRNRGNFGCRGTSTALSMLIRKNNDLIGTISGAHTDVRDFHNLFFYSFLPNWSYSFFNRHVFFKALFISLARLFGIKKSDFVSLYLEESITNLKKCLPANPSLNELILENYEFDAMVVNGEGSFIFTTPTWREPLILLMEIYWAQKMGKKVYFMNAMFSDEPFHSQNKPFLALANNVLAKCNRVVVRESESFRYALKNLPDVHAEIVPDALFSWFDYINDSHVVSNYRYYIAHDSESDFLYEGIDFSTPYVLVAGSSSDLIWNLSKSVPAYMDLVNTLKNTLNCKVYLIQTCYSDAFLKDVSFLSNTPLIPMSTPLLAIAKILANARCLISGRYHPSILASQGGTPCIFLSSNSHKTRSLQSLLQYDTIVEFNSVPTETEIPEIISLAHQYYSRGLDLRRTIQDRAKELCALSNTVASIIV